MLCMLTAERYTMADAQRDYADSYTLSGCGGNRGPIFCGVYVRVLAQCTVGSGDRCPGGSGANGNTDPTLCDGAPVYQHSDGRVLLRLSEGGGTSTQWIVSGQTSLSDCMFHGSGNIPPAEPHSSSSGRPGYAPTAVAYGEFSDGSYGDTAIVVATGGGR